MRPYAALIVVLLNFTGCSHLVLERKTINQASTTTDLQYKQVLDNMAMFEGNSNTLAWHLKLSAAMVQVTDQGTGTFASTINAPPFSTYLPTISAQRGLVGQWNGIPAVEPMDLRLLQVAYQKAIDPMNFEVDSEIHQRICELSVTYNVLLSKKTLEDLIDHMPAKKYPAETSDEHETRKHLLKTQLDTLYRELDKEFDRLAEISRPATKQEIESRAEKIVAKLRQEKKGNPNPGQDDIQEQTASLILMLEKNNQQKSQINQTRVGVADKIVRLTQSMCELPYIERYPGTGRAEHNLSGIEQAQAKIKVLMELAHDGKYQMDWICKSKHVKDIPRCACYVGHWHGCGGEHYVWVMPEHQATLRDFTVAVLTLAPIQVQESSSPGNTGSVAFSPTIAGSGR